MDLTAGAPFPTSDADDRETPLNALQDVDIALQAAAAMMGKVRSTLRIYDPYYCAGALKNRLVQLGYSRQFIHNDNVDCYSAQKSNGVPPFDFILTNPPYSGDHIQRSLTFACRSQKPWAFLLPSHIMLRPWCQELFSQRKVFYLVPHSRYSFEVCGGRGGGEGTKTQPPGQQHVPLVTMWYICVGEEGAGPSLLKQLWQDCDRAKSATLAGSFEELPRRVRKLLPFVQVCWCGSIRDGHVVVDGMSICVCVCVYIYVRLSVCVYVTLSWLRCGGVMTGECAE